MAIRFAEDSPYWQTTVQPAASLGEISELLNGFGVTDIVTMAGQAAGRTSWLVRFAWSGRSYRFAFTPLPCRQPEKVTSFGGKRRKAAEQAIYQMGRIAVYFVKAILTAAEVQEAALFAFLELPGGRPGGLPPVTSELDVSGIASVLPALPELLPALKGPENE